MIQRFIDSESSKPASNRWTIVYSFAIPFSQPLILRAGMNAARSLEHFSSPASVPSRENVRLQFSRLVDELPPSPARSSPPHASGFNLSVSVWKCVDKRHFVSSARQGFVNNFRFEMKIHILREGVNYFPVLRSGLWMVKEKALLPFDLLLDLLAISWLSGCSEKPEMVSSEEWKGARGAGERNCFY